MGLVWGLSIDDDETVFSFTLMMTRAKTRANNQLRNKSFTSA